MFVSKEEFKDKVFGALYGFAIGDAMGATTEFMSEQEIKSKYGRVTDIVGGGWLNLESGQVTDDTQMSMCVAEAIMESATDFGFKSSVRDKFIRWYKSNPPDVGNQCAKGIQMLMAGKRIPYTDNDTAMSQRGLGNGGLMRAMPCALMHKKDWNLIQNNMTHPDWLCVTCLEMYHKCMVNLLTFSDGDLIFKPVNELLTPTGHVFHTLSNASYWAGRSNFELCMLGAVNRGGDADTISAIAGSLAGAKFGFEAIPKRWIEQLDNQVKEQLNKFANFIFSVDFC